LAPRRRSVSHSGQQRGGRRSRGLSTRAVNWSRESRRHRPRCPPRSHPRARVRDAAPAAARSSCGGDASSPTVGARLRRVNWTSGLGRSCEVDQDERMLRGTADGVDIAREMVRPEGIEPPTLTTQLRRERRRNVGTRGRRLDVFSKFRVAPPFALLKTPSPSVPAYAVLVVTGRGATSPLRRRRQDDGGSKSLVERQRVTGPRAIRARRKLV